MYRTFDEAYDWEVDDPVTVALVNCLLAWGFILGPHLRHWFGF